MTVSFNYGGVDPNARPAAGHSLIERQVFTASGTYTPTKGLRFVIVEVVGGGGQGGTAPITTSTQAGGGCGGGAGGYSQKKILASAIGVTETITIGAGGTGGGDPAGTGGTSSFGSHCQATGGVGGLNAGPGGTINFQKGGAGGVGSSGDINLTGGAGGTASSVGETDTSIAKGSGSAGGNSYFGGGGEGSFSAGAPAIGGVGAPNTGGGGGGSSTGDDNVAPDAGGIGGSGIVIVWEYGDILSGAGSPPNATLRGLIDGFITSNGTDAVNDIDIAVGVCRDSANLRTMELTSALGKQIDVNWAEGGTPGTPAGGFPSGLTLTNDTTYHLFVISKLDGTLDAGFDTSLTAANLLSDASAYTDYRRIWSVKYQTATIRPYTQNGNHCEWADLIQDLDDTTPGTARVLQLLTVPLGIKVRALFNVYFGHTSTAYMWCGSPDKTDSAAGNVNFDMLGYAGSQGNTKEFQIYTNTSGQVAFRHDTGTVAAFKINTYGYEDQRGKQ